MPDTFSMSLVIACIYFGSNYLENDLQKNKLLFLNSYVLLMLLGILSKLPSGYLLIIFVLFFFDKKTSLKRIAIFTIVSIIGTLPVIAWYYFWVPYLVNKYGFWHFFMGIGFEQGFYEITQNFNQSLSKFYDTPLKFIGFAVFVYGLVISTIKKEWKIYLLFILTFLSFSIVVFKAGYTFAYHSYYIIPFVPVMALIAGYGLTKIRYQKIALLILIAISIEGIANQQHDFRIKNTEKGILNLERDLNRISKRSDLILINSGSFPTPMYFSHRKGWINSNEEIINERYINELKNKGLKFIVILKRSFGHEIKLTKYKQAIDNEDYSIYDLTTIKV